MQEVDELQANLVYENNLNINTDEFVRSFRELSEVPTVQPSTVKEKLCEKHFADTHFRKNDNHYSVALPLKQYRYVLGEVRKMTHRWFLCFEKQLLSMSEIYNQYIYFMKEYYSLGHSELVSNTDCEIENKLNYI